MDESVVAEAVVPPPIPTHRIRNIVLPLAVAALVLVFWDRALAWGGTEDRVFPTPYEVGCGLVELAREGRLFRYVTASLVRIGWGFLLALAVGVPLGFILGLSEAANAALNPLIQILRPISPIAWIPLAILWFGVTNRAPIFLIFLASVFPISVSALSAVQGIQPVYLRAARNFELSGPTLLFRVILPATLPQLLTSIRIALGIAWLVVVAAEMIVVDPRTGGLGYLIIDARSGSRYDLVVAGMVLIGVIGLLLDLLVRQFERFDEVRWGLAAR
jgi:NitT/TauT family transport system permease protein